MTIERLIELIDFAKETADFSKIKQKIEGNKDYKVIEDYLKQFDPKQHPVHKDKINRPDKVILDPKYDKEGNITETVDKIVNVSRLSVPLQQTIVSRAASFLLGNPIELDTTIKKSKVGKTPEENLFDAFTKTWDDNKLDYESKSLAKLMFSETECAELWYTEDAKEGYWDNITFTAKRKLRMRKLAFSLGDFLYPVFDPYGDMIAFARGYTIINDDDKEEEHFDVYTDEWYYLHKKTGENEWEQTKEQNFIGKIPVVYYSQAKPEWYTVQEMIDRLETLISNHADTNDYNGSPIVLVSGTIKGFAAKGERGKVLQLEEGADAKYMSWDSAPESIKLEIENLLKFIFNCTDTPNVSPEAFAGKGNYSITELKMLFLGAHLKASDKEEIFGKAIQRRINYIKAALSVIGNQQKAANLVIKPKFEYYIPSNVPEVVNTIVTAIAGGVLSKETGTKLIAEAMGIDQDAEFDLVKAEQEAAQQAQGLDGIMNE